MSDFIINRVKLLLSESEKLPDTDYDKNGNIRDFWGEQNHRGILINYFSDVLKEINDQELLDRLEKDGLSGSSSLEVYRRINGAGHPIRDRLILIGCEKSFK